MTVTRAVGVAY